MQHSINTTTMTAGGQFSMFPSTSTATNNGGMRESTRRRHNLVREAYEKLFAKTNKLGKRIYSQDHIISTVAHEQGYSERYVEDIVFNRV